MQYGIYAPNFGPFGDAQALAELAQLTERSGWDGFFTWDHLAGEHWPPRMVDPWVGLTAVALSTERVRIGALVTPLPRRRPQKVARETASLDLLSGGRLVFGVGIGDGGAEWADMGEETDMRRRGEMLDEALEVLTGLWRGEPFSHAGSHYTVRDALFLPKPPQAPRIPVWVAGTWPHRKPFLRAARWDGAFPNARDLTPAALRELAAFIARHRESDAPFDLVHTGSTPQNPHQAAGIIEPFAEAGLTWWLEMIGPAPYGVDWRADDWPLDALRARIEAGPPPV